MPAVAVTPEVPSEMGQVMIRFSIENTADIDSGRTEVRTVWVESALMDTGASHLCLPADIVQALGLAAAREVLVETPGGAAFRRILRNALIRFEDREAQVEVVELPTGSLPLFGAIPMELLGVEPDTRHRTIRRLPKEGPEGFVRA